MFKKSLSNKILFYFIIISLSIMISSYFVFERITKKAFYEAELEKAKLIAKTVKPLVELDIYLGLNENINNILKELSKNENILSVRILKDGKLIKEIKRENDIKKSNDAFLISTNLNQPNSDKILGRLEIVYSSTHYKNLLRNYEEILLLFVLALGILFFIYGYYLNRLINPLKRIAKDLENYSPKDKIYFDYVKGEDEIGAISKALNSMQNKILEYSKKQESINRILEQKVQEKTKELRKQLYTDSLTGLPNRFSIIEKIKDMKKGSVIIVNIDDFKQINDFFGHETGDKILKGFANRLKNLLKTKYPKLYRLSGDEFALLFDKKMTNYDMNHFINLLLKSIENMTFIHKDNELSIRVTIGATTNINSPLEKADIALKLARKKRLPFKIYDEKLNIENQYKDNIEWVKKIKKAIDKDRIIPYFQPIYHVDEMYVKGYECLMRLIDENGEIVTPNKFLEIAKKSRYYHELTKIMFEKSCKYFKDFDCVFSFNLSIEDILNDTTVEFIKDTIDRYKVQNKIIFEIVESEGIENYKEVYDFIENMKTVGVKIAVDDFGSGYSNFEYLTRLPIDYIKIDGSLIKNIDENENALIVVETIVNYARKRKIYTVAEFVSDEKIFEKIKELNINFAQGYYFGKPSEKTIYDC